jgi:hypothetical protein
MIVLKSALTVLLVFVSFVSIAAQDPVPAATQESKKPKIEFEYKLLATNRTTTMEKEMNDAAAEGYRFMEVISGETFFGGSEALVVMIRPTEDFSRGRYAYQLLATTKTSTMQRELQTAADAGYEHVGQSVFKKTFGTEVMVILERDNKVRPRLWDYKLLATRKTSTMQKEVMEAAAEGYQFVGFSSGSTFFGGNEVVTIMRRPRAETGGN